MKNVMYFYNGVQSEEELHDDEVVAKLTEGQIMERVGEYWKIVGVETVTVASEPERTDVVGQSFRERRRSTRLPETRRPFQ
jgi:hypothetical protein